MQLKLALRYLWFMGWIWLATVATTAQEKEYIAVKPPEASVKPGQKLPFTVGLVKQGKVQQVLPWDFKFSCLRGSFAGNIYTAPLQPGSYIVFVHYQKLVGLAMITVQAEEELERLEIVPAQISIKPGEKQQFQTKVYGKSGKIVEFAPAWGGKGGKVEQDGAFVAGQELGKFEIVAVAGSLKARAEIEIVAPPAPLARLEIFPKAARLQIGDQMGFRAQGYDQTGKTVDVPNLQWQVTGGSVGDDGLFHAGQEPGKFELTATSGQIQGKASLELVLPPPVLTRLELSPATVKLQTGQKYTFQIQGADQYGKTMPAKVQWQTTGGIMAADGVFTAGEEPGKFEIVAIAGQLQAKAALEIVQPPSVLSRLEILPPSVKLQLGEKSSVRVQGYDQYGKPLPASVQWQATGGTILEDGQFQAGDKPGKFEIVATVAGSELRASASVVISAATPYLLLVAPKAIAVAPGQKIRYELALYRGDKEVWTWPWEYTFFNTAGTFDDTTFTAPQKPGIYQITIRHPHATTTVTVEVREKTTDKIVPVPEIAKPETKNPEPPVATDPKDPGDKQPTKTDGQPPVTVPDTSKDKPEVVVTKPEDKTAPEKTTVGEPKTPLTKSPLIQIVIEPQRASVAPKEKVKLKIVVLQNGQRLDLWPWQIQYNTSGGILRDMVYTAPEQEGEFEITAQYQEVTASAYVTVKRPPAPVEQIVRLYLSPAYVALHPGEKQLFKSQAYLSSGELKDVNVQWAATGGTIDQAGFFVAGPVAGKSYTVMAYHEGSGLRGVANVRIDPFEDIVSLKILPTNVALTVGQSQQFTLKGFNRQGKEVAVTARWFATGGTITKDGLYAAGPQPGNYEVTVVETNTSFVSRVTVRIIASATAITMETVGAKWGNFLRTGEITRDELREYFEQELFFKNLTTIQQFHQGFIRTYGRNGRQLVSHTWYEAVGNVANILGERVYLGDAEEPQIVAFLRDYVVRLSFFEQEAFRKGFIKGYNNVTAGTLLYEQWWRKAKEE